MNLHLIGYRGTGKTTVAELLAARLGWPWFDADVELERETGRAIAEIFADGGEEAFRELESRVLARLCGRRKIVLGVGGGGVLREQNRAALRASGKVIWLQASPETIYRRVAQDPTTAARRPNLTNAGGLPEIEKLLEVRAPIYRRTADLTVDTEGKSPAEVADEILARLNLAPARPDSP
jgi:shikimate kinase